MFVDHAFACWQDLLRVAPGFADVLTRTGASLVVLGHDTLGQYFGGTGGGLSDASGVAAFCPSGKPGAFVLAKALTTKGNTRALVLKEAAGAFGRAWAQIPGYGGVPVWLHKEWQDAWKAHPELAAVAPTAAEYFTMACVMSLDGMGHNLHADVRRFVEKCLSGAGW